MFELLLTICMGAVVVCFIKGLSIRGVALLAGIATAAGLGIIADNELGSSQASTTALLTAAVVAVVGASAPAGPNSWWVRRAQVAEGKAWARDNLIVFDRPRRRLHRTIIGGLLGLLPGVVYTAIVFLVVEIFDLSGDAAQIGYLGVPLSFFGAITGAAIGFAKVPQRAETHARRTEHSQEHHRTPTSR